MKKVATYVSACSQGQRMHSDRTIFFHQTYTGCMYVERRSEQKFGISPLQTNANWLKFEVPNKPKLIIKYSFINIR